MEQSAPEWGTPFPRNIVVVLFQEPTSRSEKQHAIDAIQGIVVGGAPIGKGGFYYVRITDDGTSRPLFRAIQTLKSFPQVESASPELPDISPLGQDSAALARGDTSRPPVPSQTAFPGDSTFTVGSPDYPRSQLLYYRNVISIAFDDTTSGTTVRRILQQYQATIIGGVSGPAADPEYIVAIPDPGPSLVAVDSVVAKLGAEQGVKRVTKTNYRTPIRIRGASPRGTLGSGAPASGC
jgi:hypothetical protein